MRDPELPAIDPMWWVHQDADGRYLDEMEDQQRQWDDTDDQNDPQSYK